MDKVWLVWEDGCGQTPQGDYLHSVHRTLKGAQKEALKSEYFYVGRDEGYEVEE